MHRRMLLSPSHALALGGLCAASLVGACDGTATIESAAPRDPSASAPDTAARVAPSRPDAKTSKGFDVNGDGFDDVVVGAESGGSDGEGTASLYLGGAGGLSASVAIVVGGPGGNGSTFGGAVASAGDVNGDGFDDVIVGAKRDPNAAGLEVGAAYVYLGSASGLSSSPAVKLQGHGGYFGASVASAGDVNGDGFADVVVGAPLAKDPNASVFVYLGGSGGVGSTPTTSLVGSSAASFGASVAAAGDVNGDGFGDVVVGAPNALGDTGEAFLYLGGPSGLQAGPVPLSTALAGGQHGGAVAGAGDVNGDGFADLIIGSFAAGAASLYQGGAGVAPGVPLAPSAVLSPVRPEQAAPNYFGSSVTGGVDLDGDGFAEVIVAAAGTNTVYVYRGGASGLSLQPVQLAAPGGAGLDVGANVAGAGDIDGDGFADLLVSAYLCNGRRGESDLYLGGPSGTSATPASRLNGDANAEFGVSAF